jgi:hypothetical protein
MNGLTVVGKQLYKNENYNYAAELELSLLTYMDVLA